MAEPAAGVNLELISDAAMKIVIADDHPLVLDGVRTVFERIAPAAQIFEAQNHKELIELFGQVGDDFDLIVLDLNMPGMGGFEGLEAVQKRVPTVPIVILSGNEDRVSIRKAMAYGAAGYIFKSSGRDVMIEALTMVFNGGIYLPPLIGAFDLEGDASELFNSGDSFGVELGVGAAALDRIPVSVIVVDERAEVQFVNRQGRELIADKDGVVVGPTGIFSAANAIETKELHGVIKNVINLQRKPKNTADSRNATSAVSLTRPSMLRPLSVMVSPLEPSEFDLNGRPAAVLMISDPERQAVPSLEALASLYRLTDAEARLVQGLVAGKPLEDVAAEFDVKMNTIRSHLKHVFRKTGTNRQHELVKLILTSSAVLAPQET